MSEDRAEGLDVFKAANDQLTLQDRVRAWAMTLEWFASSGDVGIPLILPKNAERVAKDLRDLLALAQHDQATPGVEGETEQSALLRSISNDMANAGVAEKWWRPVYDIAIQIEALPTTIRGGREEIDAATDAIIKAFDAMKPIGGSVPPKLFRNEARTFAIAALSALPASIGVEEKQEVMADLSKPNRPGVDDSFASPTGWQPIETKDRTERGSFLVWCPERGNTYMVHNWIIDGRQAFCYFGGHGRELEEPPSHWMPRPASPSDAQSVRPDGGEG